MKSQKKQNPEIEPIPQAPPYSPRKTPEISPKPEKNEPYHPSPEIKPNFNPEISPSKEK